MLLILNFHGDLMTSTDINSGYKKFYVPSAPKTVTKTDSHILARKREAHNINQKKAVKKVASDVAKKSVSQSGNSGESSSSGSGITTENDAGYDSLSGDGGGYDDGSGSSDGSDSSSGTTSPLLEGNMSFEELIGEICNGIDLIFLVKRSTVVVTDYESLYAEAKYLRDNYHDSVVAEDIALWQLEDGTYELEVSEYGFYNTVRVHYKNGTVTESYEDLVRVYGEVAIDYYDKKVDKTTAIMKAKAYLAAHVRDFDMSVKANLLHDADIDIGDIVTLENPQTMRDQYRKDQEKRDPEYFFVMGNSISWDGDGPITNSIELRYGAKSPEKKEVPETGTGGYLSSESSSIASDIPSALDEVGKKWSSIKYSGECQTASCVRQKGRGDCWGCSAILSCELESRGVKTRIVQYPTSMSAQHRSVQYQDSNGQWKNFPYRKYGFYSWFNDTSGVNSGREVGNDCG